MKGVYIQADMNMFLKDLFYNREGHSVQNYLLAMTEK